MALSDLKKFKPNEILAYVIVGLSPIILGLVGAIILAPQLVGTFDYKRIIAISVALPIAAELAFVGIALGAMYDEIDMAIRARAAMLSGASFFFISGLVGLACAWLSNQVQAMGICLLIGWLVLGIAVRKDTVDLEAELDAWRAGKKPPKRSSHFYWTRREEIFKSLRPVDWESRPPL